MSAGKAAAGAAVTVATSDVAKQAYVTGREAALSSAGEMAIQLATGNVVGCGMIAAKTIATTAAKNAAKKSAQAALLEAGKAAQESIRTKKDSAERAHAPARTS